MDDKRLFLLDGHALIYRAHFAFINRPLINSKGINTGSITGFVRTLWDLLNNQKPSHIAVAFDPKGGTFRNEIYPEYKANRDAQPEDITIALPYVKSIIEAFKIPIIMVDNYEADDVIGTIAKQSEKEGYTVYMVTPDKDYGQLVSDKVFMYKPSRSGNGIDILGVKEILETWDIERVDQVIDVLGLQGDSVDNIPGIPGIGPKTATKLLKEFDSLEGILANADKLSGKQKENVITYADQARLSKVLATINTEVPITFDALKYQLDPPDKKVLAEIFKELEFRTLATQILGDNSSQIGVQQELFPSEVTQKPSPATPPIQYSIAKKNIENVDHTYHVVKGVAEILDLVEKLSREKEISFDTETTGLDPLLAQLVGMVFSVKPHEAYYVPVPANQDEARTIAQYFKSILENNSIQLIGQNIKYDALVMRKYNVVLHDHIFDTMLAHYLCEPDLRHKLDYISETMLDYHMVPIEELIGKGVKQISMRDVSEQKVKEYAGEDADITLQLKSPLKEKLKDIEMWKLYEGLEIPLSGVLARMEYEGVRINPEFLKNYSHELQKLIDDTEKLIYEEAGLRFNISSPKQVGEVLFDHLKIPYRWKKTATKQYSTDVEKLTELSEDHKIINDILEYRKYTKLKSTYVDALPTMINPNTGRVHTSYNQARAATGRLSSENPNLQNIPIKNEAGREIRKAFEPRDRDHILLAADYSQIELRLIAEISKDEFMLESFKAGNDFHRATAAKVYGVPYDDVTPTQRRNAKTVNFSITYGAGSTNLSRQLGIPRSEAKDLIDNYFVQFSGLKKYMDDTVEFARKNGYVETMMGRKRFLRDIDSRNSLIRSNAERMAINTPIQGTAADMIKIAMIDIDRELTKQQWQSKMILQVHDELVFDVYKPELDQVKNMVVDKMKKALPNLEVPIVVDTGIGENWLEAH
ncbi:MAG TPA: DNA polymerase I [Saprospiraceae bacterium]|nr:DNA polymerase I [Saprospiraceae bacterium]MCB9328923.1 DNA polymerase I [Lewinellaceae bacterium]HPK08759.1 DNA polymerase I [Saprospiraceae bacterium]HPQ20219.1 DNA polymerase I [Saprospiraceae bacterium]HRX28145.1 DNA polymerase I [Saprospiraceae bacterium]